MSFFILGNIIIFLELLEFTYEFSLYNILAQSLKYACIWIGPLFAIGTFATVSGYALGREGEEDGRAEQQPQSVRGG